MADDNYNRDRTTSFIIDQGLHRTARDDDQPIGKLAREGVVHGVADELNGICWLCASYIGWKTGAELVSGEELSEDIDDAFLAPDGPRFDLPDEGDHEKNYPHIAGRMMVPERRPVELCKDCYKLVGRMRYASPDEFPVAYYYRGFDPNRPLIGGRPWDQSGAADTELIVDAYAAEVAAVTWANSVALYERGPEASFWWAIHPSVRDSIRDGSPPWRTIAKYSNAHRWGWGEPATGVFHMALNRIGTTPPFRNVGRKTKHPGWNPDGKSWFHNADNCCPACGSIEMTGGTCPDCLYTTDACPNGCGELRVSVHGQIEKRCSCGHVQHDPGFEETLLEKYDGVFSDIRRYVRYRLR